MRINNTQTSHSGNVYDRDYVIDYTSIERDDLMIYAEGNGQLDYVQREVYAGSERIEQFTDRSNGGYERTLYVHEDVQGNTRYYTKTNGNSFAELTYDAWGMPVSPNKLLNNDHGNYVYATYTGHIFDTTLDIYFAEARFYDAQTRTWLAMDPIKDGGNWYQYCFSNPVTFVDWLGLAASKFSPYGCGSLSAGLSAALDASNVDIIAVIRELSVVNTYTLSLVEFVKLRETLRLELYNNGATIGYGFDWKTNSDIIVNWNNKDKSSITQAEAERLLYIVLDQNSQRLNDFLRENNLELSMNSYDAAMDLIYNRGLNNLTREVVRAMADRNDDRVLNLLSDFDYRYLNATTNKSPQQIKEYLTGHGGLKTRREEEYQIYKNGYFGSDIYSTAELR